MHSTRGDTFSKRAQNLPFAQHLLSNKLYSFVEEYDEFPVQVSFKVVRMSEDFNKKFLVLKTKPPKSNLFANQFHHLGCNHRNGIVCHPLRSAFDGVYGPGCGSESAIETS